MIRYYNQKIINLNKSISFGQNKRTSYSSPIIKGAQIKMDAAPPTRPAGVGYRHVQYMLMFAACTVAYGMRGVLNVAIIAITEKSSEGKDYPTYPEWESKKNLMLSSFFWGYICLQVGAGQLAKNYGPKIFLCCAIFVTSLFTILIPVLGGAIGYGGIILCRIVQGLSQGFLVPSIHNLLSQWTPTSERATWSSAVYAGQALGNVIAMPITGIICSTKFGWPAAFYVYGSLGMTWCIIWIIFGSDSPKVHKRISDEETNFIGYSQFKEEDSSSIPTPWKSIFTSLPMFAIVVAHFGQNWGFWTLLTEIPSFMQKILNEEIASNSTLSALPYFVMWLLTLLLSPVADLIVEKKVVSLIASRKIFNTIGFGVPALALILLCFVNDKVSTIALLVIAVGFNSAQYSGFNINHIDLSPVHCGTLMAITNSTATIASILAPLAVDLFVDISGYSETNKSLWNIVFCVSAGVYIVSTMFYVIFASGKLQPWNNSESSVEEEKSEQKKVKLGILRKISVISVA